jgi:hypothetical protein
MSDESSDNDNEINDDDDEASANNGNTIAEDGIAEIANDDDDDGRGVKIYTIDELLKLGLRMVRYRSKRIRRTKRETNLNRFRKQVIAEYQGRAKEEKKKIMLVPVRKASRNPLPSCLSRHHLWTKTH